MTVADLQEQATLNLRISGRLSALREGVARLRAAREQLQSTMEGTNLTDHAETMKVVEALTGIENALVQTGEGKIGAQLKPMLQRQLTYLYDMTTSADQKPGRDAYLRLTDIERSLAAHLFALQQILDHEVPVLLGTH